MENRTKALDVIYDLGDIGREPMIRLFAPSATDLTHRLLELAT
jgi:predicted fused transcriptional regulator/phosphomethylpyrimidine kinase